jgi:glucose-6-phosphate 1-dehydrogenase
MNHCLVFGARGHLARTRILPVLEKMNCPYTPISRSEVANLHHIENTSNVVAYMSIPTHDFCENTKPYLNLVDPLYILEKPHGHSLHDFERIQSYVKENNLRVLYNDHYLGKPILDRIEIPDDVHTIKIVLHEKGDMNERINYFDTVGIIGDMYQSHCVLLFATLLAKLRGVPRRDMLNTFRYVKPHITELSTSELYLGKAPTQCKISMKYEDIQLEADIAKMVEEKKGIYINNETFYRLSSGPCPYETVFKKIIEGDTSFFLDEVEVQHLWNHFSIMEY